MGQLTYAQDVAESLRENPLCIDSAIANDVRSKTRESIEEELAAQSDDGIPVYVIITERDKVDSDLGVIIHAALGGQDSIILTLAPSEGIVWSTVNVPADQALEYHQRIDAGEGSPGDPPATQVVGILRSLRDESFEVQENYDSSVEQPPPEPRTEVIDPGAGLASALVLIPVLMAAAAVTASVILKRRRRARARYRLPAKMLTHARELQASSLRRDLSEDSLHIAERLQGFDTDHLDDEQTRRVEHGLDAYALAGRIVDDPASGPVDLAGALVLLSIAARDLDAVERSAPQARGAARRRRGQAAEPAGMKPRRLCAFDPTHGESTSEVRDDSRAGGARIPACAHCAADVEAGRSPDWLYDGAKPYVEADTIWARTLFGAVGDDHVTQLQREKPGSQRG